MSKVRWTSQTSFKLRQESQQPAATVLTEGTFLENASAHAACIESGTLIVDLDTGDAWDTAALKHFSSRRQTKRPPLLFAQSQSDVAGHQCYPTRRTHSSAGQSSAVLSSLKPACSSVVRNCTSADVVLSAHLGPQLPSVALVSAAGLNVSFLTCTSKEVSS